MKHKWIVLLATGLALLQGCANTDRQAIPVVDESAPVSGGGNRQQTVTTTRVQPRVNTPVNTAPPVDSGVVVTVPQAVDAPLYISNAPITTTQNTPSTLTNADTGGWGTSSTPSPMQAPSSIPNTALNRAIPITTGSSKLAADEQLDGPILALLTTAQQQQGSGDLNGAVSSLERAQRIAPREPQVLYRLAQIRLNQGDPAQAEQLSRRALSYAAGRPALMASLWELIAQSREKQGDAAGAAQARQRAKVNL